MESQKNAPEPQVIAALQQYFAHRQDIDFVYLFNPLQGSGRETWTDYDIAIAFHPACSLPEIFIAQIDIHKALRTELKTEKLVVVAINDCPLEYQKRIYETGTAIEIKNRHAHAIFCQAFQKHKKREPVARTRSRATHAL